MPSLILVRHSIPAMDSTLPTSRWRLLEEGRSRCIPLAKQLIPYQPEIAFTSIEPKARETGEIIAQHLHIPCYVAHGLHEHERENVPFFATREQFQAAVEILFKHPGQLVFGSETADQALTRYDQAVQKILATHPGQTLLIVSHGTVMALFIAKHTGINALDFWRSLKMPDVAVLTLPEFQLETQP